MTLIHKDPSSPCIGYCSTSLGDTVCQGCGRTAREVDHWLLLDEAQTRLIWERINGMDTIRNRRTCALASDQRIRNQDPSK
jgi:hypothetical protein